MHSVGTDMWPFWGQQPSGGCVIISDILSEEILNLQNKIYVPLRPQSPLPAVELRPEDSTTQK